MGIVGSVCIGCILYIIFVAIAGIETSLLFVKTHKLDLMDAQYELMTLESEENDQYIPDSADGSAHMDQFGDYYEYNGNEEQLGVDYVTEHYKNKNMNALVLVGFVMVSIILCISYICVAATCLTIGYYGRRICYENTLPQLKDINIDVEINNDI
eukprot:284616_1